MESAAPPTCLLVIPTYRDRGRLQPFLGELMATLPAQFAIRIVDDGSGGDEGVELAKMVAAARRGGNGPRLRAPVVLPKNRGKGAAVRAGWGLAAEYQFAGFADADGSVSAAEILRGYAYLRDHAHQIDGILASRMKALGRHVERKLTRHLSGRVFATIASEMSGLPVYDTQCGFKLLKSAALAPLLPELRSDRFAFDVELILALTSRGARLQEFPVDWIHRPGSKVSVFRDTIPMLLDVWRASRRWRKG